jgi:F-type H+-transporting ATPase subunit gamma
MQSNPKILKQKIKSINSLQKITKAMEMIARSKMKKAIDTALLTRVYAILALKLLVNVSKYVFHDNVFLNKGKGDKILIIYVASDKGLCGGYNLQVFKELKKYTAKIRNKKNKIDFICIGKYASINATKIGGNILREYKTNLDYTNYVEGKNIYNLILEKYKTSEYQKAIVVYTNYVSIFKREPTIRELIPISKKSLKNMIEKLGGGEDDIYLRNLNEKDFLKYEYEPNAKYVLDIIIPELISNQVYQSILESKASEESARMVAMKSASDSGNKMAKELEIVYNRARQSAITKEIIEISSGAEAVA